jgi:hypothetical protein
MCHYDPSLGYYIICFLFVIHTVKKLEKLDCELKQGHNNRNLWGSFFQNAIDMTSLKSTRTTGIAITPGTDSVTNGSHVR